MSRSKIEREYGVPLAVDVLWRELESRYGSAALADLQAIHRQATQRYGRAARLNQIRLISYWERRGGHEQLAVWKAALADPQAFIDRE